MKPQQIHTSLILKLLIIVAITYYCASYITWLHILRARIEFRCYMCLVDVSSTNERLRSDYFISAGSIIALGHLTCTEVK